MSAPGEEEKRKECRAWKPARDERVRNGRKPEEKQPPAMQFVQFAKCLLGTSWVPGTFAGTGALA